MAATLGSGSLISTTSRSLTASALKFERAATTAIRKGTHGINPAHNSGGCHETDCCDWDSFPERNKLLKLLQILYAALWAYDHGYGMEPATVDVIHKTRIQLESEIAAEQVTAPATDSAFLM